MSSSPLRLAGLLTAAGLLLGCNVLTGADAASVEEEDDSGTSGTVQEQNAPPPIAISCAYPPGPFGVDTDQILPVNQSWEGFAPHADMPGMVHMADLYDCDGSRGINAILFDTSQFG